MIRLQTERLIIRQFELSDGPAMDQVFGDAEVMRFGSGTKPSHWVRDWLLRCQLDYQQQGFGLWAVVEASHQKVMGYAGLTHFPDIAGQPEIEIGYRLARSFWGQGFATEAARAIRDYGFEELNLNRLISLIDPENTASIRVAEKIGMQYEKDALLPGYSHPDRVYALTQTAVPSG